MTRGRLHAKCHPVDHARLLDLCAGEGQSLSAYLRDLVNDDLEARGLPVLREFMSRKPWTPSRRASGARKELDAVRIGGGRDHDVPAPDEAVI